MNIQIRDLEENDSDKFADLLVQLSRETTHTLMTEEESIALGKTQHTRTQQLILASNHKILLATHGELLVGFVGLTQGLFERNQHCAALMIGVLSSYWKQGIASQLIQQSLLWAKERGIVRIEVDVLAANERAIKLYQRFEFKKEGTKQAALFVDNTYLDEILMARVECCSV